MFHFQWHITERCNFSCKHCYKEEKFIKEELTTEEIFYLLDKYYKQLEAWKLDRTQNRISFTGGEPFVREDFWEILGNCYQNKDKVSYGILSNGSLINEEVALKLRDLGLSYFQVSLEGLEEVNDEIRGAGTFKKAVNALKLLKEKGIYTSISMTITKTNLAEIPKMIELVKELHLDRIGIRRLVPIGMGKQMQELMITPAQTKELFEYIIKENERQDFYIGMGCEEGLLAQEHYLPNHICNAGYHSFSVMPNADVYPCRRLPILCGNLMKHDFDEIMMHSKELKELRNLNNINKDCQSCPYFNECLGGAKCISNAYFKDPFAPDPQCWRLFKKLEDQNKKWEKNKNDYRGIKYI